MENSLFFLKKTAHKNETMQPKIVIRHPLAEHRVNSMEDVKVLKLVPSFLITMQIRLISKDLCFWRYGLMLEINEVSFFNI